MGKFITRVPGACFIALSLSAWAQPAAQPYPTKPIRMLVGFTPGGGTDIIARLVGQKLTERWGQTVVVDNRAGASGNIAADIVAKSQPDGHTLLMAFSSHAANAASFQKLPFDIMKDFTSITIVASAPMTVAVHPSLPARNLTELIQIAKAKPGALRFGSSGVGTPVHLVGEWMQQLAGVSMVHVPYKGIAPAMIAILGGEIQVTYAAVISGLQHYLSGRLRAIAVASAKRFPALADVPTSAESGLPGFETDFWYGLVGPAAMPRPLVDRIQREVGAIVQAPDMKENLLGQGSVPGGGKPEELTALIKTEYQRWAKVVKTAGVKLD